MTKLYKYFILGALRVRVRLDSEDEHNYESAAVYNPETGLYKHDDNLLIRLCDSLDVKRVDKEFFYNGRK